MEEMETIKPLENINIAEVCRACFETCEQYKMLFDEADSIEKRTLGDVFFDVVKIEMKANSETPPSRICISCSNDLMSAYSFIQKSQKNNERLLQYLKNANIKKPDCLTEFPMDIPADQNIADFLHIKVEDEGLNDYNNDSMPDDRHSPENSSDSDGSDYEPLIQKKQKINKMQCTYCDRIFKRQDFLENHIKKHEADIKKKEVVEDSEDETAGKKRTCQECGFSCNSKLEMDDHKKAEHTTSDKRKRKSSNMWTHFNEENYNKAKCKYCSRVISIAGNSMGNLQRHVKFKHPLIHLMTIEAKQPKHEDAALSLLSNQPHLPSTSSKAPSTSKEQTIMQCVRNSIDKQILKMIANGYHSLRIVDEPEFKKFIEMVSNCPGYKLPTRKDLYQNMLPEIYNGLEVDLQQRLLLAPAVCLTTDAWTSCNSISYIAITAHFVDSTSQLCSALISCKEYNDRFTNSFVCRFLMAEMTYWQISNKVVAIVTDNTRIITAVKCNELQSIECLGHSLNHLVQAQTKEIDDTLQKVKAIVEYFKRNTPALNHLKETQKRLSLPELELKQDVPSRWNSTYDMLKRIMVLKDALISSVAALRGDLSLNLNDWNIIEEVLPILEPFYQLTIEISSEKNVFLSKAIVIYYLLQRYLATKCCPTNEKVVKLLSLLKNAVDVRLINMEQNPLYAECTILDPRFKKIAFNNPRVFENAMQGLRKKICDMRLPKHETGVNMETTSTATAPNESNKRTTPSSSIWDEYDNEMQETSISENKTAAVIKELDRYLDEDYLYRKMDPLKWWEERKYMFPNLYAFVLQRFCIVASCVPCERIFSASGQIISERKMLLPPDQVSKLVFLHNNM